MTITPLPLDELPPLVTTTEEFLRKVMLFIRDNPERWNQQTWVNRCGTSHCLAGWAYVLGTGKPFTYNDVQLDREFYQEMYDTAVTLLGLTEYQASELFYFYRIPDETGMAVRDPSLASPGWPGWRKPTFEEFAAKVAAVTGVDVRGDS